MSTTFYAAIDIDAPDTTVRRLTCEVIGVMGEWTGYAKAYGIADAHKVVCSNLLCQQYGPTIDEVTDAPEVNVGRLNDAMILEALGYPTEDGDLSGADTAEAFLGRVLVALAISPEDEGMPMRELVGNERLFGCRETHMGRRPGYLQDVLGRLRDLAETCRNRGVDVHWA